MKNTYQGITFAEGYNKTFAEFKDDFASTHVFKNIPSAQREAELEKAYEIATGKKAKAENKPAVKTEK